VNLVDLQPLATVERPTLILSDLHLPAHPSPLRKAFVNFLTGPARGAAAVYILGDLFEAWVGDDVGLLRYRREVRELCNLTESGVPLYIQHGNRDFLLGARFRLTTGAELLPDPFVAPIAGIPTLLSHGDRYCTDDRGYQRWRKFCHWEPAQNTFLRLPSAVRARVAGDLRKRSTEATRAKPAAIMDVNPEAIAAAFAEAKVSQMIHGHTHRPAEHHVVVDGIDRKRIVLSDWRPGSHEYLRCLPGAAPIREQI